MVLSAVRRLYKRAKSKPTFPALLDCQVVYNKYGGYCVPSSSRSRPACRAVLSGSVWEPQTIELIRAECGSGDIVHAGTFFGDFLPALSRGVSDGAKVWAFEPSAENYRCARVTTEINGLENVVLARAGLGDRSGAAKVKTSESWGPMGGLSKIAPDGNEAVALVRIDDVVRDREVSVIQLDVEGYEKEALSGALETIKRCRPLLIIEETLSKGLLKGEWFDENVLALGYSETGRVHDNAVLSASSQA